MSNKGQSPDPAIIDLAHARVRLRSRPVKPSPAADLEAINLLLDMGHSAEARVRLTTIIAESSKDPTTLARGRLALSLALEMHAEYRQSLQALAMYESPEELSRLPPELALSVRIQIAIANNYGGDHPKAIALLNAALREQTENGNQTGSAEIKAALARVYRSINEFQIARDHSQQALDVYRQSGLWRGLAEAYFGIAITYHMEGQNELALENFQQALQLIGEHPATFMLGKIYSNMAAACWWLKRPQEGIQYLEKAIGYYEHTDHKQLAADGHNNLAINLILVGEWQRAQAALERALTMATQLDANAGRIAMILDSLGELCMLRGNLDAAKDHLEGAVAKAVESGNHWYSCQAWRTMARYHLVTGASEEAMAAANQALELANAVRDRQAICESQLLLAEANLNSENLADCDTHLKRVSDQTTDSPADIGLVGETQRLRGLLALAQSDGPLAVQHFGRTVSVFELLGDRYRSARAHLDLGRALMAIQPSQAAEHLQQAVGAFRQLGAARDLATAESALAENRQTAPQRQRSREAVSQLITLRLAEAVASRALLLRELAAVIRQETGAKKVLVCEPDEEQRPHIVYSNGHTEQEQTALADEVHVLSTNSEARQRFARKHDAALLELRPNDALPAIVLISPKRSAETSKVPLEPLLRVVELAMDVCFLRTRTATGQAVDTVSGSISTSLMPGFIHSSPAMTRLVEEVHKIRSSDVTVLVTGESGTGKELVARAIHALSSRREKIFVPFNCTAVPKELSESYLFGHRRGAFTGAISDSPGVIRTAAGGTLFIDEVGDLPLDAQPKLLRFLQEGEIQPLGERQPIQIDVRIIAATNTDLEQLVAEGRFREDLYYRLNVIRLRVPPLRERRSEIPAIVNYYINHYSAKFGRHDIQISPQAIDLLMVADWPGNVRQLCNEVQRIVARTENNAVLTPDDLSPELRHMAVPTAPTAPVSVAAAAEHGHATLTDPENLNLADALEQIERRMIADALRRHRGNISRAARELGLTRRGLYLKIERYEIEVEPLAGRVSA